MLTDVQNDMLAALDSITAFKKVGVWQGDLDNLLKTNQATPSAHVTLASGLFGGPKTMPPSSSLARLGWDVIIIYQCLTNRSVAVNQGYGLIEAVVKPVAQGGLTGLKTQGGMLWPLSLDLIDTVNGISAYGIRFEIERSIA